MKRILFVCVENAGRSHMTEAFANFFGNTNESGGHFLKILGYSREIAQKIELRQFLDKEWNLSVPKIIDNAIISKMSPKYNKQS